VVATVRSPPWASLEDHAACGTAEREILGSARIPLSEMVKLDYLYVANWSLWDDVKILLRTVPFVVGRRGM